MILAALLASSTVVSADPESLYAAGDGPTQTSGSWYDVGFLWVRVGDATPYAGEVVRFAPRVALGRTFYIGGEADFGTLSGTTPASNTTLARGGSTGEVEMPATGSVGAAKAVVGMHAFAGIISGAAELAAGVRHASMTTIDGMQLPDVHDGAIVEAHGRLDLWLAPKISLGAIVGVDLLDSTNVSGGLILGFHFSPYDHAR